MRKNKRSIQEKMEGFRILSISRNNFMRFNLQKNISFGRENSFWAKLGNTNCSPLYDLRLASEEIFEICSCK